MKLTPFPLTSYLISLIEVQNGFSSLQMKKKPILAPDFPSAKAISFTYQRLMFQCIIEKNSPTDTFQ